ncbi:MAG: transposase [Chloroflexi bacterium]|nr:transposase [Chloroflexota bacterium]
MAATWTRRSAPTTPSRSTCSRRRWTTGCRRAIWPGSSLDHLDLSPLLEKYRGPKGYPPYDPRMMVKVLLYAYATGVRSSRKIEQKL